MKTVGHSRREMIIAELIFPFRTGVCSFWLGRVLRGQFDDVVMLWSDQKFGTPHTTPTQPQPTNLKSLRPNGSTGSPTGQQLALTSDSTTTIDAVNRFHPDMFRSRATGQWKMSNCKTPGISMLGSRLNFRISRDGISTPRVVSREYSAD